MIKHVILWNLKSEYTADEKADIIKGIKTNLEALAGKIPGLLEIKVQTECLPTSNADVMLYSVFENEDALKEYAVHPEHVRVADNFVRPFTSCRSCIDFEDR